jgi:hypothetical protein
MVKEEETKKVVEAELLPRLCCTNFRHVIHMHNLNPLLKAAPCFCGERSVALLCSGLRTEYFYLMALVDILDNV